MTQTLALKRALYRPDIKVELVFKRVVNEKSNAEFIVLDVVHLTSLG